MACQKVCKQGKDDIIVKVNLQSLIPASFSLKYCMYCASAPSLHRESTDSLINNFGVSTATRRFFKFCLEAQRVKITQVELFAVPMAISIYCQFHYFCYM